MNNIIKQDYFVDQSMRCKQNGHNSFVLWFTGLSGSGKSTIANKLERKLYERGIRTYSLDGDNIRGGLNNDLSFSKEDRHENIRRIAEVARLFVDAGMVTITAFISPRKEDRGVAKGIIGQENFLEIFVNTPLEVCEQRDVKGLYKKARKGEIKGFTGVDAPYENPVDPDIEIKTTEESIEESVDRILREIKIKLEL